MLTQAERDAFDALLEDVLAELPEHVTQQLEELPVIVEDELGAALRAELGLADDEDLLGLYSGDALPDRADPTPYADHVLIFRGPIMRLAEMHALSQRNDPQAYEHELARQVRITLLHELGHHYGLDEDDLDQLGYA